MRRIKYGIWCLLIVISLMAGGITAYAEGEERLPPPGRAW